MQGKAALINLLMRSHRIYRECSRHCFATLCTLAGTKRISFAQQRNRPVKSRRSFGASARMPRKQGRTAPKQSETMTTPESTTFIIVGLTTQGRKFRPSDWAER
ncbi:MAG TPA: DUF3579 domain-containing protein, partial [Azonexus sp.]|nr:DUF3579 domain-containing protein [Azonexus sp.]